MIINDRWGSRRLILLIVLHLVTESGSISLASAMADATGGQKLPLMKATTMTVSNIVGGSERYLAAAVARLDCAGALVDSIQARPPKEEVWTHRTSQGSWNKFGRRFHSTAASHHLVFYQHYLLWGNFSISFVVVISISLAPKLVYVILLRWSCTTELCSPQ